MARTRSVMERLMEKVKVDPETGCWTFTGNRYDGYGRISVAGRMLPAHRVSYEDARGHIPDGLQLDHLCRNRACVNPDHLEAIPQRENIRRSDAPPAQNLRRTHCKNGHQLVQMDGQRGCPPCKREAQRRHYERNRGQYKARAMARYEANREEIKAQRRAHHRQHADEINAQRRAQYRERTAR